MLPKFEIIPFHWRIQFFNLAPHRRLFEGGGGHDVGLDAEGQGIGQQAAHKDL